LAISIARAELLIAYKKVSGQVATPLVFHSDTGSLIIQKASEWKSLTTFKELQQIEKDMREAGTFMPYAKPDFTEMLKIENVLRQTFRIASRGGNVEAIIKRGLKNLKNLHGKITKQVLSVLEHDEIVQDLSSLIRNYGNGVWAISITSLFAPYIILKQKPDIIITNPPWIQLTKVKGDFGEIARRRAKEFLGNYGKSGNILTGSDLSTVLLWGGLKFAKEYVAYVMPREAVYEANSLYPLGKLLFYEVVKRNGLNYGGKVININYDAFHHGIYPATVFLQRNGNNIDCYSMDIGVSCYSKALSLDNIEYRVKNEGENYDEYISGIKEYEQSSNQELERYLGVVKINVMGDYVRGLFGGKDKSYAGLCFNLVDYDETYGNYIIQLTNTSSKIKVPEHELEKFWKKMVYINSLYPFYQYHLYDILLPSSKEDNLEQFLVDYIRPGMIDSEKRLVDKLVEEAQYPHIPTSLKKNKYYVLYREKRAFASVVITHKGQNPKEQPLIPIFCAQMEISDKTEAFYYSSILNYFVYLISKRGFSIVRNQYGRPILAIYKAGLKWRNEEWQYEVAKLCEKLHTNAPQCYNGKIKIGMQVKRSFDILQECEECKELLDEMVTIIEDNMDEQRVLKAIRLVAVLSNQ